MTTTTDRPSHRPGAISVFFVYKAGLFALCFWGWLGYLAIIGGPVTGWHIVAATGAISTMLAGVCLGIRLALQRNAATRHQEVMKTLVEISWDSFSAPDGQPGPPEHRLNGEAREGDAGVIQFSPDLRQRPRR